MGGRAAHIQVSDRRPKTRIARHRPQEEKLLERKLALKNVALAQTKLALQIERRHYLPVQNDVLDVGRVLRDGVHHGISESFLLIVPVESRAQLVGRVLHKTGEHMLARRRDRSEEHT